MTWTLVNICPTQQDQSHTRQEDQWTAMFATQPWQRICRFCCDGEIHAVFRLTRINFATKIDSGLIYAIILMTDRNSRGPFFQLQKMLVSGKNQPILILKHEGKREVRPEARPETRPEVRPEVRPEAC
jgi:hypothetical protein